MLSPLVFATVFLLHPLMFGSELPTANEQQLLSACKRNGDALQSATIHFTVQDQALALPGALKQFKDRVYERRLDARLTISGEKFRLQRSMEMIPWGHSNQTVVPDVIMSWDGKEFRTYAPTEKNGILDISYKGYDGVADNPFHWIHRDIDTPLEKVLKGCFKGGLFKIRTPCLLNTSWPYKGHNVWRLSLGKDGQEGEILFDPAYDLNMVYRHTKFHIVEVKEYKKIDSVWVPMIIEVRQEHPDDNGAMVVSGLQTWRIIEIENINQLISPETFTIEYPTGSKYFDVVQKKEIQINSADPKKSQ